MKQHGFSEFQPAHASAQTARKTAILGSLSKVLTVTLVLSAAIDALAASSCRGIFDREPAVPYADLKAQARNGYGAPNVQAFRALEQLRQARPALVREHKSLYEAIHDVLKDEEFAIFHMILKKALNETRENSSPSKGDLVRVLEDSLARELSSYMPESEANERASVVRQRSINRSKLLEALGMNETESLRALVGPRGIRNPSKASLVGQFLEQSKKLLEGKEPSTLVSSFKKAPNGSETGDARLFIAVDGRNAALAQQLFGENPHLLIHDHEPQQGTLQLMHMGYQISYAQRDRRGNMAGAYRYTRETHDESIYGNDFQPNYGNNVNVGSILPLMVLSTTEASRASNYFELGTKTNNARTKYPWSLKEKDGETVENYCRPGGYTSCTHWVGEMAIGDKLVDRYSFPGNYDSHAGQEDPSTRNQRAIRTGPVGTYTHFEKPYEERMQAIGESSRVDRLTRMVWKENKGNMQLWEMLNAKGPLSKGEFANPGWVLYTLIGHAPVERVPVVLVYTENATEPLTRRKVQELRREIHPY